MQNLLLVVIFGLCGIFLALYIFKSSHKSVNDHKLTNYQLLLNACFDDQLQAQQLVEKEKQKDNSISDEEAAGRALSQLLSEFKKKRETLNQKQISNNQHAH